MTILSENLKPGNLENFDFGYLFKVKVWPPQLICIFRASHVLSFYYPVIISGLTDLCGKWENVDTMLRIFWEIQEFHVILGKVLH